MGTPAPTNWIRGEKGSLSLLRVCRDVETAKDDDAVASRKARASLPINAVRVGVKDLIRSVNGRKDGNT